MSSSSNHHLQEQARKSKKLPLNQVTTDVEVSQSLYDEVLDGVVRNVKMGPFKATSGIDLPCK